MNDAATTFREDLAAGKAVEQAVGAWAIERGWTAHRTCGAVGAYDLLLQCTVEVKLDRMATSTSNVAVETAYRGRPSGIMATTAVFWCIAIGNTGHLVRVEALRHLAERFPAVPAGDGKRAVVHLVPVAELKRIAKEIPLPGISAASDVPSTAPGAAVEATPRHNSNGRSAVLQQQPLFEKEPLHEYERCV